MRVIATLWTLFLMALLTIACGGGSSGGNNNTDTTSDSSTDPTDPTDSDSTADTETTDSDTTDTDTEIYTNPCPDGQHAECYGTDPWCFNGTEPATQLDTCAGGEICYQPEAFYADCRCEKDAKRQCLNGDVWAYNSCGDAEERVTVCASPSTCVNLSDTEADCCTAESTKDCGTDGNIHWFSECAGGGNTEGDLVKTCTGNSTCQPGNPPTCECKNQWTGTNCSECPAHWDPEKDCGECAGYWGGTDCNTCEGYGSDTDNCQCPSDQYAPQPGTDNCWICAQNPADTNNGLCSSDAPLFTTWQEASSACPVGFRLPTLEEARSAYSETACAGSLCGKCESDDLCNSFIWNGDSAANYWVALIWLQDSCDTGHLSFDFYSGGSPCEDSSPLGLSVFCIAE